jgi:AcrR family transcriptional regulator
MRVKAKRGLNQDTIVREAAAICDEYGVEKLSIAALADRLGVRPPSLYNHIKSLDEVYRLMALMGARLWTEAIREAVNSSADENKIRELAHASRAFARDEPTLFFCATRKFSSADEAYMEAAMPMVAIADDILSHVALDPAKKRLAEYLFRCLIAGFITLEANNGLQPAEDLDSLYDELIDLAASSLTD